MKEKTNQTEKEVQEASGLKTAGPEGEITAGLTNHLQSLVLTFSYQCCALVL